MSIRRVGVRLDTTSGNEAKLVIPSRSRSTDPATGSASHRTGHESEVLDTC